MDHELRELITQINEYKRSYAETKLNRQRQKIVKKINAHSRAQLKLAARGEAHRADVYKTAMEELKHWEYMGTVFDYMHKKGPTIRENVIGFVSFQKNHNNRKPFTIRDIIDVSPMINHSTANFILKEMVDRGILIYTPPQDGISGRGMCGIYSFPLPKNNF